MLFGRISVKIYAKKKKFYRFEKVFQTQNNA